MANHCVDIQLACASSEGVPDTQAFELWANTLLSQEAQSEKELTIRVVDEPEMIALNEQYRSKQGPTNVLSFPADVVPGVELDLPLLGDIVICKPVVEQEAKDQGLENQHHWAHMVIHGVLHLLGHDHVVETEAVVMEQKEIECLAQLGIANPYE